MEGRITKSTDNAVSTDAPRAQEGIAVARRHHYVPRCYLKGFSVPRKKGQQVVVFDRVLHRSFQTATTNVAVEMDFNRIDVDGHPPDAFEKGMAAFESEIGPALDRIMAARSIADANDRAYLFNLIGLLASRNPRHRERWRDFEERIVKRFMSLVTATPERWTSQVTKAQEAGYISRDANTDYAMMRKLVAEDGYTIEVPTERHIMLEMHAFEGILPYIFNRKWVLVKCEDSSAGFVTSDHPVCLMWSDPNRCGPVGYGLRETEILFPICSRLALVGAFELDEGEMVATEELVAAVNGMLIQAAERQAYARDYNFRYVFNWGETPRKASKLLDDRRLKRIEQEESEDQ